MTKISRVGLFFQVEMVWWTKISVGNFSPRTSSSRTKSPVTGVSLRFMIASAILVEALRITGA